MNALYALVLGACGPTPEATDDAILAHEMGKPSTDDFCDRHPTHWRCAPADVCGDGACDLDEDCASCADDCGACPDADCGDGVCDSAESCRSCPADCSDVYPWPDAWVAFEEETIDGFNERRAAGATCAGTPYGAQPPLVYDGNIAWAARCHAMDTSTTSGISHTGTDGSNFSERMIESGYMGSPYGEVAAAGYSSPSSVVTGWMASTCGHCDIIMSGTPTDVAVGYYYESGTPYGHYWVGDFGR